MADLTRAPAQVAVVTGASSGIGLAAACELARRGWELALVGRDAARLARAHARVQTCASAPARAYRCDFAVLAEVRELARRLRAQHPRIDVLANNAGAAIPTRSSTVDAHEATIQTNHLAPFLLSHELREELRGGRIITTASRAHKQGRLDPDDLSSRRRLYVDLIIYGASKQANILFAAEAARRWPDICSTSYHPGIVRTRFGAGNAVYALFYRYAPGLRTPEKGAETLVWLATTPASMINNGGYYYDCRAIRPAARARDPELAAQLWRASLAATGLPPDPP